MEGGPPPTEAGSEVRSIGTDTPAGARALDAAQEALDAGQWARVHDLLEDARGAAAPPAACLELRALALYAQGHFEASVTAWEELHELLLAQGDRPGASRAAATVALYLMIDSGLMAPVRGWLRRAERLLDPGEETPALALIALVRTYERLMCGDLDGAGEQAGLAIELGERLDVLPAIVIGRVAGARVRILRGEVQEGLDELEEVAVLLMSGEVDPLTTGMMYCELVCVAQGLALPDRVREWTVMMEQWRPGNAVGGLHGRCRVHRAEMLRTSGPCAEAEAEALSACDDLRPWMRREFGWPLAELGNVRLRRGDLAGAEAAYLEAHRHVWTPHPGLALVRLAQGDLAAATALIEDAIEHPFDAPSKERPPFGDLRLAPLYDAHAAIASATDDAAAARSAANALDRIASRYPSRGLRASAALADARASLLEGDVERAITSSLDSALTWADLGAPFEAAEARLVLGAAHHRAQHHASARTEWQAAQSAFELYGAERHAARAAELLAGLGEEPGPTTTSPAPHTPAPERSNAGAGADRRAIATFRRSADSRIVRFDDTEVVMRDLKGFRHIEQLLARPGRELHVLHLMAAEERALAPNPGVRADDGLTAGGVAGLPVLDDEALAAYRRRLADVDEDIDEASRMNDPARQALAERDREYLVAEITRAVGIGGRHRTTSDVTERARTAVARSIRYSLSRLDDHLPALSEHLARHIRTGGFCSYEPDPISPLTWEL
jgi:hypothetical protein